MGKASENLFWKALKQHIDNEDNKKNPIDTKDSIVDLLHADLSDKVFDKALVIEQKNQSRKSELYKKHYKSYLEKLEKREINHNDFFKMYHGAAGYLNGHKDNILIKEYKLDSIKSQTLVDIYENYFKNKFGLILLDIGPDGTEMEYGKSNGKPITFVGLDSCLGVVSKDYGIHLSPVSLTCEERYECYIDRITAMYHYVGQNANLITCSKCSNKEDTKSHVIDVKNVAVNRGDIFCDDNYRLLPSRDNERSRAMSWFCNKVIFNECNDRSEDKSIITITP